MFIGRSFETDTMPFVISFYEFIDNSEYLLIMCSGVPMHNLCLICVTDIRIPDDRSVL